MLMSSLVSTQKRSYRSAVREDQARRTRVAVLDAAASCFVERGYVATTMKDIAAAAGVSHQTVFSQGGKAALLLAVVDRAIVGDDEEQPLIERASIRELIAERDKTAKLDLVKAATAHYWASAQAPLRVFREAAAADPEIAAAWVEHETRRYADARILVGSFEHLLRSDLSVDRATEIYWAFASLETVHNFCSGRGWTMEQYADWLTDAVDRLLLD
jgi:AcrR family transcriptional regulator